MTRAEDFDVVVLGISVGALPPICKELLADEGNPKFKAMIDNARTVMTQAFQLWVNQDGVSGLELPFSPSGVAGSYVEPADTYADMSHLIPREKWSGDYVPRNISYICGVLADQEGDTQSTTDTRVKRQGIEYLKQGGWHGWRHTRQVYQLCAKLALRKAQSGGRLGQSKN